MIKLSILKQIKFHFQKLKNLTDTSLDKFFVENPAILISLFVMLGIWAKIEKNYLLVALCFLLFFRRRKILSLAIFLSAFLYCHLYYPAFPKISSSVNISGIVKITSITPIKSFKEGYLYRGRLKSLWIEGNKTKYKNLLCTISSKTKPPSATHLNKIKGSATCSGSKYRLKIKTTEIIPLKKVQNFVNKRKEIKEKTDKKIRKTIKGQNAAAFLSTLVTGNIGDNLLSFSFSKVGLQHILAISGFHFSILMLFFIYSLRFITSSKYLPFLLIIVTNFYFLYIGFSPSIFRAYITLQIAFFAEIISRKNQVINALAVAGIIEFIVDPLNLFNIGFQLSFLSVLSIFIIYPEINNFIARVLKKRKKEEIQVMDIFSKIGARLINFIRESVSLSISINLALVPVLLFYFNKFPLLGLIYNLFFPPLIFISVFSLGGCFLFSFFHLEKISSLFANFTSIFTEFILKPVLNPPSILDYSFYSKNLYLSFVIIYLIFCFFIFILIKNSRESKSNSLFISYI